MVENVWIIAAAGYQISHTSEAPLSQKRKDKRMNSLIWLSFDLGVSGDYEGMYSWLDNHEAKECGSSVACFSFSYDGDLAKSLKTEIENAVSLNNRSRVYVVYRDEKKLKGRYVIGRRKSAPWGGYGTQEEHDDEQDFQ